LAFSIISVIGNSDILGSEPFPLIDDSKVVRGSGWLDLNLISKNFILSKVAEIGVQILVRNAPCIPSDFT
jgi:hypothetical protein